jgi:hypothetical protein
VDEASGELQYFKEHCEGTDVPLGAIDLAAIVEVAVFDKDAKADSTRFNVISAEGDNKVYKLKSNSIAERMLWVAGLNTWREYFIMRYSMQQAAVYSPPHEDTFDAFDDTDDVLDDEEIPDEASEYGSEYSSMEEDVLDNLDESKKMSENISTVEEKLSQCSNPEDSSQLHQRNIDFEDENLDRFDSWAGKDEQSSEEVKSVDSISTGYGISTAQNAGSNMMSNPMRKIVFEGKSSGESNHDLSDPVDNENGDEDAYIKSMAKKYSKIAPQSTPLPKFVMPKFNMGKLKK